MLVATLLFPYAVITVHSGDVGVLWKRFNGYDLYCWCFVGRGTALNPREIREEGLHLVWPWDKLFIYSLRLQSTTKTFNAITKDGVNVAIQINIRFQLLHDSVGVLHKFIGPNYLASVVAPEIGSQARQVISHYTAQEVYRSREAIQEEIRDNSQKRLGAHLNALVQTEAMEQLDPKHYTDFLQHSIQILDTLVLSMELPPPIVAAINRQTEQYYQIQEFKYRVEREVEEAKRKQVEANGIAAFQRTVSQGISDSYLRWRGIEATLALAQSKNAKIVIIGSGKEGLPIILGNMDNNPQPQGPIPGPAKPQTSAESPPVASAGPTDNMAAATRPPEATSAGAAADGRKAEAAGAASTPPNVTQHEEPGLTPKVDLAEIKSLLSRLSDWIHSSSSTNAPSTANAPPKASGPAAEPKH
jgi:regulator of protease activity HflC (stomatin/prohibitin superfamily)